MVVAFRRPQSNYFGLDAELREIEPAADYEVVRSAGYEPSAPMRVRGTELRRSRLEISERPGSVVLEYKRVKP
jgi:hypothetical protein